MKHLQGSNKSDSNSSAAACPFAKMASMASSFEKDQKPAAVSATDKHQEKQNKHDDEKNDAQQQPARVACDSSTTSSWEPDQMQYQEDLATMTQKCPVFAQQQNADSSNNKKNDSATTTTTEASFSCPFKDQAGSSNGNEVMRETLLKIPASHYDMGEFVRVMEGFHHRVATSSPSGIDLPKTCPVPEEIKGKISFREAMESRSLAAIMARLAEEHDQQQQQQQLASEKRDRSDSVSSAHSTPSATLIVRSTKQEQASSDASRRPLEPKENQSSSVSTAESPPTITPTTSSSPTSPSTNKSSSSLLSDQLKSGTAVSHQAAENVHFVRNFIRGKIDRDLYSQLVLALYHVYDALEEELDAHAPDHFTNCHFPDQLRRVPALKEDVDFWHGAAAAENPPTPSSATQDYIERIHYIATTNPLLLLAHSYTRYLGDLSGGKILARVARRALNLSKPTKERGGVVDGLAFYHFSNIESDKLFKDKYRQALDDLHLTKTQITQLVAEANVAFLLNMRIFEELDVAANLPGATVRPLQEALEYAEHHASDATATTDTAEADQECPFLKTKKPPSGDATATATHSKHGGGGRCPWPFVVFHDPVQFVCDWQTMVLVILIGLLLLVWQKAATTS